MSTLDRRVQQAFVQIARTLTSDFDVIDFLGTVAGCAVDLLGAGACGILLADHTGSLDPVAASTDEAGVLELSQLQNADGPCLDAFRKGSQVAHPDLAGVRDRWPTFAPAALAAGFAAVHALPMRLREQTIGTMILLFAHPGSLDADTAELGQALADAATIGVLGQRTMRRRDTVTEQLQAALTSWITIEQARGVLAERMQLGIEEAFAVLRRHARDHGLGLAAAARAVTEGEIGIGFQAGQATAAKK